MNDSPLKTAATGAVFATHLPLVLGSFVACFSASASSGNSCVLGAASVIAGYTALSGAAGYAIGGALASRDEKKLGQLAGAAIAPVGFLIVAPLVLTPIMRLLMAAKPRPAPALPPPPPPPAP